MLQPRQILEQTSDNYKCNDEYDKTLEGGVTSKQLWVYGNVRVRRGDEESEGSCPR